jgi:guanylate kinase
VTTEPPVLLVVAGPAGSGKSTLCDRLVKEVPGFARVVTTTTREPRPGEIHGLHYHFLTPEEFDAKLQQNAFLEWAWVHGKRRYGTLAHSVLEPLSRGQSLVISVDVQGVESFRRAVAQYPQIGKHMTTVFILVDRERLIARMRARAQDNEEEIAGRMRTAERELREASKFDFTIESRTRDEDFAALLEIVAKARARAAAAD